MSDTVNVRGRRADDWADIYKLVSDERVLRRTLGLPYPQPDTIRERVAEVNDDHRELVAEVTQPGGQSQVVGTLSMRGSKWPRRKHVAKSVLVVHPDYQGQGVGMVLMEAAVNLADDWLGLRRLQLVVQTDNAPAIALYEQFGFKREATLRRYAVRDGEFIDAYMMARINEKLGGRRKADRIAPPADLPLRPTERPQVTVRGQCADDWEDLYALLKATNVYSNTMQLPYPSPDFIRQRFAEPSKDFFNLVVEVNGRAVGHSGLEIMVGRRAHVAALGMAVRPDYQGMGVGSALMEALIDVAENWSQIRRLELEVYPDNPRAIALYEKFGFEHEGRYRDFGFQNGAYIDALVMARLHD